MPSHSKQLTNSSTNKPASSVMKVKSKNKRRNRKKKKQKVQYPIHEMRKMTNTSVNSEYNATDADCNLKQNQMAVAQMWAKTYETMIRLQYQHRIQYWKNLAINRDAEIQKLKEKLQGNCTDYDEIESADEDETSAKCTGQKKCEESEESDESYLKFLEITLRHRQQRKRNRENEADSK
ncbi:uncharacterized protein LOC119066689 [Bradysia coprophila]|uniref:uncharacterized protein LOC119066689 n=1 Tax=Bradysia coprophila TaxID=38358 RepID=UPI00187D8F90|nr:uncharacterized protein LOC119066689 [Bradysia coprophila]